MISLVFLVAAIAGAAYAMWVHRTRSSKHERFEDGGQGKGKGKGGRAGEEQTGSALYTARKAVMRVFARDLKKKPTEAQLDKYSAIGPDEGKIRSAVRKDNREAFEDKDGADSDSSLSSDSSKSGSDSDSDDDEGKEKGADKRRRAAIERHAATGIVTALRDDSDSEDDNDSAQDEQELLHASAHAHDIHAHVDAPTTILSSPSPPASQKAPDMSLSKLGSSSACARVRERRARIRAAANQPIGVSSSAGATSMPAPQQTQPSSSLQETRVCLEKADVLKRLSSIRSEVDLFTKMVSLM